MGGGGAALAAGQSVVEVDVAQVLRRPFRQTHLVVVVDDPPMEETRAFISRVALPAAKTRIRSGGDA